MGSKKMMKALADDDDEMVALAMALAAEHQASSSRRRRAPDAPPRQETWRDHAYGDARIRADYFGDSPVYNDTQFRKRYVGI
jgi:hypothetical protein